VSAAGRRRPARRPFTRVTVTLPTFIILALRILVDEANEKRKDGRRWTLSLLLGRLLFSTLSEDEIERATRKSAAFRRESKAWMKWMNGGGR